MDDSMDFAFADKEGIDYYKQRFEVRKKARMQTHKLYQILLMC